MVDDAEIAKARALAAGALGEKMGKFPLLFAKAAFFGERPSRKRRVEMNNGTVTLADLGSGPLAITCQHVIAGLREKRERVEQFIFQLGFVDFDPLKQMVDENERLDLATIRLTAEQAKAVTSEDEIGSCVFKPTSWPPPLPAKGEFVAFGDFLAVFGPSSRLMKWNLGRGAVARPKFPPLVTSSSHASSRAKNGSSPSVTSATWSSRRLGA